MQFVTMDFNLADRILKSPYCISVISWTDGVIDDIYSSYISPDCDIEEAMIRKNHIEYDFSKAPSLPDVWSEVSSIISGQTVFFPNGSGNVGDLIERLGVDYLTMPDMNYASFFSMVSRVWPDLSEKLITEWSKKKKECGTNNVKTVKEYNFTTISEHFETESRHYNSLDNPLSMGNVINKALAKTGSEDPERLFEVCGYAGGIVTGGHKVCYRSVKEKKSKEYYRHFFENI